MVRLSRWRWFAVGLPHLMLAPLAGAQCQGQWLPTDPQLQVSLGTAPGEVHSLLVADLDGPGPQQEVLLVGGRFSHAGGLPARNLAAWDGTSWTSFGGAGSIHQPGAGPSGEVSTLLIYSGELVIASNYWAVSSGNSNVYHRVGDTWLPVGTGGPTGIITAMVEFDARLVVAGSNGVACWNGTSWGPLGLPNPTNIQSLLVHDGVLYAGGRLDFPSPADGGPTARNLARWDGAEWRPLAATSTSSTVASLLWHNDALYAGTGLSGVQRLETAGWADVGMCIGCDHPVIANALAAQDGQLFAAGLLRGTHNGGIGSRFDGAQWVADPLVPRSTGLALAHFRGVMFYGGFDGLFRHVLPSADFNHDGLLATDADIQAFFACLAGDCCLTCATADFNGDGDTGTDADIEAFFRVLAGGRC